MKLVPPKKVRIFSYKTFSSQLILESKSLEITFREEFLNVETLFEIESILAWCTSHTEVKTILFNSTQKNFISGFDFERMKDLDTEKINKLYQKLHTINQTLLYLPQTIVVDLKNGAKNEGLTLALCADIRIASTEAVYQFNQTEHGLMDASGTFSVLGQKLNHNVLRSLILSGIEFNNAELQALGGFVMADKSVDEILNQIAKQSNVARVQTKCALVGTDDKIADHQNFVQKLLNATLATSDYKKEKEFINLRDLKDGNSAEATH